jgi:hypothetical protein
MNHTSVDWCKEETFTSGPGENSGPEMRRLHDSGSSVHANTFDITAIASPARHAITITQGIVHVKALNGLKTIDNIIHRDYNRMQM